MLQAIRESEERASFVADRSIGLSDPDSSDIRFVLSVTLSAVFDVVLHTGFGRRIDGHARYLDVVRSVV